MSHDHHHSFSHYQRAFAIGVTLNIVFVVIELFYGLLADSLALIADAGHNFSDVLSLLLAWGAHRLAQKSATKKHTYGFRKATIIASLASAVLLLFALGGIAWEAMHRFVEPQSVEGSIVIVVAAIGVVINSATALLFFSGQKHDLNLKAAFVHMAADALISLGVVIAGVLILLKGWQWIDPVLSLVIVVVILLGTWSLLRDSLNLAIDAVPEGTDIDAIGKYLSELEDVLQFHDLHVWALSTTEVALTVHLVMRTGLIDNRLLHTLHQELHDRFDIEHATIQIEHADSDTACRLDRECCA